MKEALTKAISSLSEGSTTSSGQKHVGTLSVSSVEDTAAGRSAAGASVSISAADKSSKEARVKVSIGLDS
eukprot:4497623-Karenia_brevis.AAC.1